MKRSSPRIISLRRREEQLEAARDDAETQLEQRGVDLPNTEEIALEVGSRSTGRRDFNVKREGYPALGIRECWRFDPSGGEYHAVSLAGDTMFDGEYVPIEIVVKSDGRQWGYSEILERCAAESLRVGSMF